MTVILFLSILRKKQKKKSDSNPSKPNLDWGIQSLSNFVYSSSKMPKMIYKNEQKKLIAKNSVLRNELEGLKILFQNQIQINQLEYCVRVNLPMTEHFRLVNENDQIGNIPALTGRKLDDGDIGPRRVSLEFPK